MRIKLIAPYPTETCRQRLTQMIDQDSFLSMLTTRRAFVGRVNAQSFYLFKRRAANAACAPTFYGTWVDETTRTIIIGTFRVPILTLIVALLWTGGVIAATIISRSPIPLCFLIIGLSGVGWGYEVFTHDKKAIIALLIETLNAHLISDTAESRP
jgi:hypothetical protein